MAAVSRQVEECPFFFISVPLRSVGIGPLPRDGASELVDRWLGKAMEGKGATTVRSKVNVAGICNISRRLMAIEMARALGKKPLDLRAYVLEMEARRWTEKQISRAKRQPRLAR